MPHILTRPADAKDGWQDDIIPPVHTEPAQNGSMLDGDETETEEDDKMDIKWQPYVVINDLYDKDMPDYPESPSPIQYEDDLIDPVCPDDEEELTDTEEIEKENKSHMWPKITMPEDADFEPILELDPVEDMKDEDGVAIKAWRCVPCNLRFQYFASYSKHNEREHPNYKPKRPTQWVIVDDDSDLSDYVDDGANLVDSDDSDYNPTSSPIKKKTKRMRCRVNGRTDCNEQRVGIRGKYKKKEQQDQSMPRRRRGRPKKGERPAGSKGAGSVKEEPRQCSACPLMFENQKAADSHYRRNHFLPYHCLICDKRFDAFKKYYVHSEMVHDTIVDDILQATLSDPGESDSEDCRVRVEGREEPVLFPCDLCTNLYGSEIVLAGHKLRRHAEEIPDLAVIESNKRLWRTRFEPENIQHYESVLQQLGPLHEERAAAGLPPLAAAKQRRCPTNTRRLSDEERERRLEERRIRRKLRKAAGIKLLNEFGPRDSSGQFMGHFRTEEQKELTRVRAAQRRNEKRRLLYQVQKEAKEKGLPIPKNLTEAGIDFGQVPYSTHPYRQLAIEADPVNIEQLVLEAAAEGMDLDQLADGEPRPKRQSQIKAIENIKGFAKKLGVNGDKDGENGEQQDGGDTEVEEDNDENRMNRLIRKDRADTDFQATDDEDESSDDDSDEDDGGPIGDRADQVNGNDPQHSTSGVKKKKKLKSKTTKKTSGKPRGSYKRRNENESMICPFTGKILAEPRTRSRRRKGEGKTRAEINKERRAEYRLNNGLPKSKYHEAVADSCRKCGQEFENDNQTMRHIREAHFDPANAKVFSFQRDDPPNHAAMMRRARVALKCKEDDCTSKYAYVEQLAEHMQNKHHKKMFNDEGNEISTHLPESEASKPPGSRFHVCSECDHVVRGHYMKRHVQHLHQPDGLICYYPCDFPDCTVAFRHAFKLIWHRRSIHMKMKNIACTYCDKKFGTPYQYRKHVRIHEGFRHQCHFCSENFGSNQGKINHETTKHGNGPQFGCDKCDKRVRYLNICDLLLLLPSLIIPFCSTVLV